MKHQFIPILHQSVKYICKTVQNSVQIFSPGFCNFHAKLKLGLV